MFEVRDRSGKTPPPQFRTKDHSMTPVLGSGNRVVNIEPVYDDIETVHIPMTDVRKDRPRPNRQNRHGRPTNVQTDRQTDGQNNQPTDRQTNRSRPQLENVVIENRAAAESSAGQANENEEYKFGNLLGFFQSMDTKN